MQGMQGKMTYLTYTMTQYNSIIKTLTTQFKNWQKI